MDDLVEREGLYYKKFSDVPFTGEIEGREQGKFTNGKKEGPWFYYYPTGQLWGKGEYRNGEKEGPWIYYWGLGQLKGKGTFKNGKEEGPWVIFFEGVTVPNMYSGIYENGVKISD